VAGVYEPRGTTPIAGILPGYTRESVVASPDYSQTVTC